MAAATVLLLGLVGAVPAPAAASPAKVGPDAVADTVAGSNIHLTDPRLRQRLTLVPKAAKAEHDLRGRLGAAFGGLWISGDPAVIHVGVTSRAAELAARAAGAVPVHVRRGEAALNAIKASLDRDARLAPPSITGWYVDLPSNSVVVQALPSGVAAAGAFARSAAADASAIRVVTVAARPRLFADIRGGDAFYTGTGVRCSIGFAVYSSSFTPGYVTAGHCGLPGTSVTQGTITASLFPGSDYAWVQAGGYTPRPLVDTYNGGNATVAGSVEAPVGSPVCRSGSTSGWHCGTILAKNQTVVFGGTNTVYGLTQTNACSEPGDSGGSFISGDQAQGVTSGGSGNCSGGAATTYFQPVNPILSTYGLYLVTDSSQRYNLVAVHSGKCLDVADASTADGAAIHQWTCSGSGSANQKWRLLLVPGTSDTFNLVAWHSGKCADVTGASTDDGALVHQWYCYPPGGTNQQWRRVLVPGTTDTYNFIAVHSGKCLDVSGGSLYDGAAVHQWTCSPPGGTNQQWRLVPVN